MRAVTHRCRAVVSFVKLEFGGIKLSVEEPHTEVSDTVVRGIAPLEQPSILQFVTSPRDVSLECLSPSPHASYRAYR